MLSELSRQQWSDGSRALERESGDAVRYRQLCVLVDAITDELRKRLGTRFVLSELVEAYDGAEDWVRELVADSLPPEPRVGAVDVVLVLDAACDRYARGAGDYRP
jgi:hypothetical protein